MSTRGITAITGEKLLDHVAKRWAKTKVGKDAKSKLKLIQAPAPPPAS